MKLEKYRDDSYEFSKQTSDLIRQFAFAGIAIIWIFKFGDGAKQMIPSELIFPLLFFIITLVLDLFQYLIPTIIWSIYYRVMEKLHNGDSEIDVKASGWLSVPGWLFFLMKITTLIIAYYSILKFLIGKL